MNKLLSALAAIAGTALLPLQAQQVYELQVADQPKTVREGHLKLGGKAPDGGTIDFTSFYMRENGRPVIPLRRKSASLVSGEMLFLKAQ